MKTILLALVVFFGLNLQAQITITLSDVSLTAHTAITAKDTTSFLKPWASGANQVWDFSALAPTKFDTTTNDLTSFSTNPLFPNATHGSCTTLPIGSVCVYMDISSAGMYTLGLDNHFTVPFNSHQVSVESPAALVYPFPLNYNTTASQSYVQHQLNVNGSPAPNDSVKIIYYRTLDLIVDGWGTLKTPYNTYTTLRVKSINSNLDSTFNHKVGGSWSLGQVNKKYIDTAFVWLANGVFEVASVSSYSPSVHRYTFLKTILTNGVEATINNISAVDIYPNPVSDFMTIQTLEKLSSIHCTDAVGKVFKVNQVNQMIDVSSLSSGVYILSLVTEQGQTIIQKFVKQ